MPLLKRVAGHRQTGSPPLIGDARDYAVASRATVANPPGQWQLRVQVIHWRGPTAQFGPTATQTLDLARARLRDCQVTAPLASPSITTNDPFRLAAVISVPGQRVLHQYVVAVGVGGWYALAPYVVDGVPVRDPRGVVQDENVLAHRLRAEGITYGAAQYWLAYRLTFEIPAQSWLLCWSGSRA